MTEIEDASLNTTNITKEELFRFFCQFVDFPSNGIDCSINDPTNCVQCSVRGAFITGESINNPSTALIYFYAIWAAAVLISVFGIFSNAFLVKVVLKRSNNGEVSQGMFHFLLSGLAIVDGAYCVSTIAGSTALTSYFGNWFGRGKYILYWNYISMSAALLFRTISTYVTILITLKGYLAIAFPIKSNIWFTRKKTKCMYFAIFIFAVVINYPRFSCWSVEKNSKWRDVNSLKDLDYIVRSPLLEKYRQKAMGDPSDHVDFLVAPLLLLLLNILSLLKVRQLSKQRKGLNIQQRRNISAVRMFLPVVVIYLITHSSSFVGMLIYSIAEVVYREFIIIGYLSNALNCALNLTIYYWRSKSFRKDVRCELKECFKRVGLVRARYSFSDHHGGNTVNSSSYI